MAGASVIESLPTGTSGIPVTPSVTYSTLAAMKAGQASCEARTNIRWYQASGAASAITVISNGTFTALSTSAWTTVQQNAVTSPADAAFAAVEIEWRHTTTTVVGQFINVDNVVFSRSNQAAWGPGGSSTNIKFVVERSADGAVSWEAVWGQNYDNPAPARSQSDTRIIIRDRAAQLNNANLQYRCYAIGYDANNLPVYSLPTVTAQGACPPIKVQTGFLRLPTDDYWDWPLQVDSYTRAYTIGGETFAPQGSLYGVVQYDTAPQTEKIDYTVWCIGPVPLNVVVNLLQMKATLCIQLAINSTRYVRPVGDFTLQQVRAAPTLTDVAAVRTVHKVQFSAITIAPPAFVNKLVTV